MNEDGAVSKAPGTTPGVADSSPALGAGGFRALGRGFKSRGAGIVGVAALVVVGSILGSAALSSSGASAGSTKLRTVLSSSHSAAAASGATITVTGNGQVEGTPDTATFQVGVDTTAATAVEALEENNSQVATLEASLEQNGVLAKNMQTSWLNLSANTNSKGRVTGFSADDELNVTTNDLSDLGAALDAAVEATGNGVTLDGISFSISNQSALLAAARAQAMQAASTEATQVAAGGGLALGPIVKITDQDNAGQQVYYAPVDATAAGSPVPVQAGQEQLSVQVTVVYQLVAASS